MKIIYKIICLTLLVLNALLIVSCGTLFKKEEYLKVDSEKRGVPVYSQSGVLLGVTPFIIKNPKPRTLYFKLNQQENNLDLMEKNKCDLDWGTSIVSPAIIGLLALPNSLFFTASSWTVDYFTNNYYSCSDHIVKLKNPQGIEKKYKKRLIIAPIFHRKISNLDSLIKPLLDELAKEYELIDYQETLTDFTFNGSDESTPWNPLSFSKENFDKIAFKYQASHVLTTILDDHHFDYKVYDIFSKEIAKVGEIKVSKIEPDKNSLRKKIINFFYFKPNAFLIGYENTEIKQTNGSYTTGKNPHLVPEFLTLLSIEKVSSPYFFNTWDIELRASPSLKFPAFSLNNNKGQSLNYSGVLVNYDFTTNFHTPAGALALSLGPALLYLDDNNQMESEDYSHLSSGYSLGFSYLAFISKRFYFKLGISRFSYFNQGKKISSDITLKKIDSISSGIGYYVPDYLNFF